MRPLSTMLGIGISTLAASCVVSIGSDSCGNSVRGSGVRASETRSVGSFSRIEVSGSTTVNARVGEETSVRISGDDNILPYVRVRVADDTLIVDMESGSYSPRTDLEVEVTTPRLSGLSISGSGDANVTGVKSESFKAGISGSGSMRIEGETDELTASISGSGDMELFSLRAKDAKVRIAGSGEVDVSASEDLAVSIAGSGDVRYRGTPRVQQSIAGSGDVSRDD